MATEHTLQTRILLKYDTYANWTTNNPVLKQGEMAIATIPAGATTTPVMTNLPNIVLKVGDGTSHYNDLKFISALAADVHSWAKQAEKPTYGYSEITGLEDYIKDVANAEIQDTNTTYTIVPVTGSTYKFTLRSKELGGAWTDAATIDLSEVGTRLSALETLVGSSSVNDQITEAIEALDAAEVTAGTGEIISAISQSDGRISVSKRTLVKGDIPTIDQAQVNGLAASLAAKQDNLTFDGTYDATSNKVATVSTVNNAIDAVAGSATAPANQFATGFTQTAGKVSMTFARPTIDNVDGLTGRLSGIDDEIAKKQDILQFKTAYNAETNKVATEADVVNAVADLNGAMHFKGAVESLPEISGSSYKAGDVILMGYDEYVCDGTKWVMLGNESIYQTKEQATADHNAIQATMTTELAKKQDNLVFDGTYNATSNKVATVSTATTAAQSAVDSVNTEAVSAGEGQIIASVSQTQSKIAVTTRALVAADIPELAQSKITGLTAALQSAADATTQALTEAKAYADSVAKAEAKSAVEGVNVEKIGGGDRVVITSVSQTEGKIGATTATLHEVAYSGYINDLSIEDGVTLVFDCGTSSGM